MADGMSLPRVVTNELYYIVDKRTPSLRGEVLGADTTGSAVARVGTAYSRPWDLFIVYIALFFP